MSVAPTVFAMIGIPLYVLGSFVAGMFAAHTYDVSLEEVTLSFVGDMMFDRYVRSQAEENGYDVIMRDVLPLFASSTHVFGNLEGPITTFTPVSTARDTGPDHYRFTFATTVASVLRETGFSAVTLGNNHTSNFGERGILQTQAILIENSIGYVGAPNDPLTPWRTTANGVDIVLYAYDPWHIPSEETLLEKIEKEPEDVFVVVLAHWGEEYATVPNQSQVTLAHAFVDAGVDFIAGSHPHVVQSKEQYRDVWIYYSLGNFVFDQYFNENVQCGAVVSVSLIDGEVSYVDESFIELSLDGTTKTSECSTGIDNIK